MLFHRDKTLPNRTNEIFVFGSNLAGAHGAGAAKMALKYGAKYGYGVGLYGLSYGIPTKDHDVKTMPIEQIVPYIERFKKFTLENPHKAFFVTRIGCGLAGYKDKQIAPLFKGCSDNCSFATEWREYLE